MKEVELAFDVISHPFIVFLNGSFVDETGYTLEGNKLVIEAKDGDVVNVVPTPRPVVRAAF